MQQETVNVFIAYSRKDQEIKDKLKTALKVLQRVGHIDSIWDDSAIEAGAEWERAIHNQLDSADIILLLVSPDFLASDYSFEKEMSRVIKAHVEGNAKAISVILRPCLWENVDLKKLYITPSEGKPITNWKREDDAINEIAKFVEEIVHKIQEDRFFKEQQKKFMFLFKRAEVYFRKANWIEALDTYEEVLNLNFGSQKPPLYPTYKECINKRKDECQKNIDYLRIEEEIHSSFQREDYIKVISLCEKASLLKNTQLIEESKTKANNALFNQFIEKADKSFLAMKWESSIISYKNALKHYKEGNTPHEETILKRIEFGLLHVYPKPNERDGKFGYVNTIGEIVIPYEYDEAYDFKEGFAIVKKGDTIGFIDKLGKIVIPFQFQDASNFDGGVAKVKKGIKWGIIDKTGTSLTSFEYDEMSDFSEGLARVRKENKWGFIYKMGKVAIPIEYDEAYDFSEGLARVRKASKFGFINQLGETIIPFDFD
ncbi:MAG: WG repeat-containing protein, partial [Saprospiraceae bacterium]|nr:WG repeat-containing protein [Saprospiraceae bacterium]